MEQRPNSAIRPKPIELPRKMPNPFDLLKGRPTTARSRAEIATQSNSIKSLRPT